MKKATVDLFTRIFSVLAPPPNMTVSQWADKYRRLSSESSAEPGRWRTSKAPYQREIILRGIKTGNRIRMTPLSGQYTPESYLETIRSSQLAITETEFKVMANGEQIGTLTRPNATLTTNFRQYAASKVWSFRYSYRQQAFDDYGRPKVDEHGKPVYETVEANDPVSVIYLPDGIMQFYAPYTFRGELFGLPNQTVQTFKWQLGPTSASDCYVCTDSFLDIKLVP